MGDGVRHKKIEENLAIISTSVLVSKAEKILPQSLDRYYLEGRKETNSPLVFHTH
jgi:hypothetical protein